MSLTPREKKAVKAAINNVQFFYPGGDPYAGKPFIAWGQRRGKKNHY